MRVQRLFAAALLAHPMLPVAQASAQSVAIRVNPANFQFVLPFEKSTTFDVSSQTPKLVPIGGVGWPNQDASPNCAISGAQSVGFFINPATCALSLQYDYKALDAGAIGGWGKLRNFNVTANKAGGGTLTGTIQVTFDTSAFAARGYVVPSLDTIIGRTEKSAPKVPGVNPLPTGWTFITNDPPCNACLNAMTHVTPTQNNPAVLDNWDFSGTQVYERNGSGGTYTGIVIRQSIFGPNAALRPSGTGKGGFFNATWPTVTDVKITDSTFILDGENYPLAMPAVKAPNLTDFSRNVVAGCAGDCINSQSIVGSGNYLRLARTQNRQWDGTPTPATVFPNELTSWDHADGIQIQYNNAASSWSGNYIDNRQTDWDYSLVTPRRPKGTITCTSGSTQLTGVGTTWLTGADADRVYPGDSIIMKPITFHNLVQSVDSDTQITLQANCSNAGTYASPQWRVAAASAARIQTTSPIYQNGTNAPNLQLWPATFSKNILRGGAYTLHVGGNTMMAVTAFDTNIIGDWYAGTSDTLARKQLRVENTLNFSDFSTPIANSNPLPTPPVVSTGTPTATTIPFTFSDQGSGMTYRYRYRTSAATTWSDWAAATPTGTTVTGLSASTTYIIAVQAVDAALDDGTDYLQSAVTITSATTPAS